MAKISRPPIENMIRTNSHAHTQNSINLHNTLYLTEIITLFRVYPRLIKATFSIQVTEIQGELKQQVAEIQGIFMYQITEIQGKFLA